MSKHTPGPWRVGALHREGISVDGGKHTTVAHVRRTAYAVTDEQKANALLIAAAPELLEALQCIVKQHDEGQFITGKSIELARAAIAKATGGKA